MAIDKAVDSAQLDLYFTNIADAIREKTGTTGTLRPVLMPSRIRAIPTGDGIDKGGDYESVVFGSFTPTVDKYGLTISELIGEIPTVALGKKWAFCVFQCGSQGNSKSGSIGTLAIIKKGYADSALQLGFTYRSSDGSSIFNGASGATYNEATSALTLNTSGTLYHFTAGETYAWVFILNV